MIIYFLTNQHHDDDYNPDSGNLRRVERVSRPELKNMMIFAKLLYCNEKLHCSISEPGRHDRIGDYYIGTGDTKKGYFCNWQGFSLKIARKVSKN